MPTDPQNGAPNSIGKPWAKRSPEKELRTLRLAVEQSRDGINIVDLQGNIIYANPTSESMYGYRKGQLVGRHISVLNADPSLSKSRILPSVMETGNWSGELIQKRQDGSLFPVYLSASIVTRNNKPIGMLGIIRDITESKLIEQALRQSETRYRVLRESMRDAYVLVAMDGRILEFNDLYYQMLGYSPPELRGLSYQGLTPERWHAVEARIIREQIIPRGYSDVYEKEYRRKDGTIFPVELRTILSRDTEGRPVGMWATVRDITHRKRAEDALQKLNLTLEKQVAQRTAIAESRSHLLQALAVELIEAEERERQRISELLHDDFQQILAAARFQLESALENLPPVPEFMDVERMLADLISKARQLSHELSPAVLHHSGLVSALKWLCRNMSVQFGLDVEFTAHGAEQFENMPLKIFAFRAVQELLFNIVKHADVKSARIAVSGEQGRLAITVSDQGKGFDPEILKKPVSKVGIGLLSLRERISYIGGSLTIESAPGSGSRITLTIPATGTAGDIFSSIRLPKSRRKEVKLSKHSRTAIRVLFADDHKVLRQGLIKIMSGQPNIEVAGEAVNGREAVHLARRLKPDVIVMDVSMPDMDGIEATRRIKAEMPEVRVIALSMHNDEHISSIMKAAGAEAFVTKAESSAKLLRAIYGVGRETQ